MVFNTYKHNLHLSPDENLGGGAAFADSPEGGAAPAPAFDPESFKSEILGSFRQEIGNSFQKFIPEIENRLRPQEKREETFSGAPSLEDKKYLNESGELDPKGFERYLKDVSKAERAEWEREHQQSQSRLQTESKFREVTRDHISRESEYEKANPSYRQDVMKAGDMEVNPRVGQRILSSKYSANIIHHFAKNRNDFSRFQALSYDDPESALEMIGELGYQFKSSENNQTRIPARPTRGGFGSGVAKTPSRGVKEILAEWRNN